MSANSKSSTFTIPAWFEMHLLERYQMLEQREQRVVLAGGLALALIILVFGLILPLQDRRDALASELATVQQQAAEAERLAQYLQQQPAGAISGSAGSGSVLSRVEQLARQTGIRKYMTRIKPQISPNAGDQRLMINMKDVPYDASLCFMHALATHRLGLVNFHFKSTGTPGFVHMRAVIAAG